MTFFPLRLQATLTVYDSERQRDVDITLDYRPAYDDPLYQAVLAKDEANNLTLALAEGVKGFP